MTSRAEEPIDKQEASIKSEVERRLTTFARHKKVLIDMLRKDYERGPKTTRYDEKDAWERLEFAAFIYLQDKAHVDEMLSITPAGQRINLLVQLGKAIRAARQKADDVMPFVRGHLFAEWCVANGNPDFLDPIIERYGDRFDEVVAGLAALERAAFRAAKSIPKKPGAPATSALPHDFILNLEDLYRNVTLGKGGAGPGPFARFVKEFLTALARHITQQSVIDAIKDAKKREEKRGAASRWGRSLPFNERYGEFRIGGKSLPTAGNSDP